MASIRIIVKDSIPPIDDNGVSLCLYGNDMFANEMWFKVTSGPSVAGHFTFIVSGLCLNSSER
ncbi:hypothetical protein BLOT_014178 [Blomia tropicalis]|nr:hypothetical protein BLOT_014178 [Blomia tropicalis]